MRPAVHGERQQTTAVHGSYIVPGVLGVVNTSAGRVAGGYGHSRARAGFLKTLCSDVKLLLSTETRQS